MPNTTLATNAEAMPIDRRSALVSLAAAAGALLAVPHARAEVAAIDGDPALAAIKRHRQAAEAFESFVARFGDMEELPESAEAEYRRLDHAERHAMFALADTVPTTHKGAYAALRYLVKEAGERHYSVLGICGGSLIEAKWETFRPEA